MERDSTRLHQFDRRPFVRTVLFTALSLAIGFICLGATLGAAYLGLASSWEGAVLVCLLTGVFIYGLKTYFLWACVLKNLAFEARSGPDTVEFRRRDGTVLEVDRALLSNTPVVRGAWTGSETGWLHASRLPSSEAHLWVPKDLLDEIQGQ